MSGGVPDHLAWEFCPNLKTCWAKRTKGGHGELGRDPVSGSHLPGVSGPHGKIRAQKASGKGGMGGKSKG